MLHIFSANLSFENTNILKMFNFLYNTKNWQKIWGQTMSSKSQEKLAENFGYGKICPLFFLLIWLNIDQPRIKYCVRMIIEI